MAAFINLTGHKFGRLLVISRVENDKRNRACWLCLCDCGETKIVSTSNLKSGNNRSCGCLYSEQKSAQAKRLFTKHGFSSTPLYNAWIHMRDRCGNIKNNHYKYYGARGITVCPEWDSFPVFCKWALTNGYREGLTIDRVNNDGNYEPSNCRWVTNAEQLRNTRRNRFVRINGKRLCYAEAGRMLKVSRVTIARRVECGKLQEVS